MQQQLETTCIAARKFDQVLTEVFDNFYEKLQPKALEVVSDEGKFRQTENRVHKR